MARIRSIKPEMWADEKLAKLSRDARLLFVALIGNADDTGRMRGNPLFVRSQCFPYDADLDIDKLLALLADGGFITRYEADGQSFLVVNNFCKHQKIDHPTASSIPAPNGSRAIAKRSRKPREASPKPRENIAPDRDQGKDWIWKGSGSGEDQDQGSSQGVAIATATAPVETQAPTSAVWDSYSAAYEKRYGERPTRNKKVNGQLAHFVTRIPRDEAPDVAAFYVSHSGQLYVRAMHCVDLLLRDAEGLRTQWATGRQITGTSARQQDRTAANLEAIRPLLRGDGS